MVSQLKWIGASGRIDRLDIRIKKYPAWPLATVFSVVDLAPPPQMFMSDEEIYQIINRPPKEPYFYITPDTAAIVIDVCFKRLLELAEEAERSKSEKREGKRTRKRVKRSEY